MLKHIITKKIDETSFVAWFRLNEVPEGATHLTLRFGLWRVPVTFQVKDLVFIDFNGLVSVKSTSATLKSFKKAKLEWFSGKEIIRSGIITNSGMFEDLTDSKTFEKSEKDLREAFAKKPVQSKMKMTL